MAYNQTGGGTYRLQSSIGLSDTTIYLSSFLEPISGTPYTMTSLNTDKVYATIDPTLPDRSEFISFTGITQNSDGTAALTGVTRGLSRSYPFDNSAAATFSQAHPGQAILVLSDSPEFFTEFVRRRDDEVITGNYTIPEPSQPSAPATKNYVDTKVNGGAISIVQIVVPGTAGATVAAGNLIYLDTSVNQWKLCTSATSTTLQNVLLGLAQGAGTSGNAISGGVLLRGQDSNQSGLTGGNIYYASTGGAISGSAGATEKAIGIARTAAILLFDPSFFYTPTAAQKAALAGSNGTPGSANTFVTQTGLAALVTSLYYDAATDQTQGTSNSTIATGEADATTKHNLLAQKFVAGKTSIKGVRLWKIADTGSFTGTVKISLQADSAGSPSGSDLASYTITNAAWLKLTSAAEFAVAFSSEYEALVAGSPYWIVVTCSTNDTTNHPNLGANSAGGYASGALKYKNTTDGWVLIATSILYFKTLEGVQSKVIESDTEGLVPVPLRPYSIIDMDETGSGAITGDTNAHVVYSKMLPGGLFTPNAGLKAKIISTGDASGGGTKATIKVRYNGVDLISVSLPPLTGTNGPSGARFVTEAVILNQNSQSSQKSFGHVQMQLTTSAGTPTVGTLLIAATNILTTSTVDLSQPGLLEITFTNDSSSFSSAYLGAFLEKVAGGTN